MALLTHLRKTGLSGDITLIKTTDWDGWFSYAYGESDACIQHYGQAKQADREWGGHFEAIHWINPNMDYGLLVFHKDFLKNHQNEIMKIISAYKERLLYEENLTDKEAYASNKKGLQIKSEYKDISLAVMNYDLRVKTNLLNEMESMMITEGILDKDVDIESHVDNSFVDMLSK